MLNVGAIKEGYVLDHIKAGFSLKIYHYLKLDQLDCGVAMIMNARSNKMGKKDILKIECELGTIDLDIIGFLDHNITVNIIKDEEIVEKKVLQLPKQIKNVIRCKNPPLYYLHRAGAGSDFLSGRPGEGDLPLQVL